MPINREWLDNWLSSKPKPAPERPNVTEPVESTAPAPALDGKVLANLSPAGQRRLLAILQQNPVLPTIRFVAFRAESFREKDLLDSFEAMIKQPSRRTEARYVPNRRKSGDSAE